MPIRWNFLRRWLGFSTTSPANKKSRRKPARRRTPLHIELLETRFMPSTVYWDGGGDGSSWDGADNWSNDLVPGSGDDVINETGAIQLSGAVQVNSLSLSGGSLTGGSLTVQEMTWSGGTLATDTLVEETLTLSGGTLTMAGPVTLTNAGEATWESGTLYSADGSSFNNEGSVSVDGSTAIDGVNLESSGTLDILGGVDVMAGDGNITGSVTIATGAFWTFGWTEFNYYIDGTLTNDGTIYHHQGTVHIRGELVGSGSYLMISADLIFDGATATIEGTFGIDPATLRNGATITATGGGYAADFLLIESGAALTLGGDEWELGAEVTVSDEASLTFAAGSDFYLQGPLTVAEGGTLTLAAGSTYEVLEDLTNHGTINWTPGATETLSLWSAPIIFSQSSTGTLNLEVQDVGSYDQLSTWGTAELGGTLNVSLLEGYAVAAEDVFPVIVGSYTGTFDTVNLPSLGDGLAFTIVYGVGVVELIVEVVEPRLQAQNLGSEPRSGSSPAGVYDFGAYQVNLQTGNLHLEIGSTQQANPFEQDALMYFAGLIYNSQTVTPQPIVAASVLTDSDDPVPSEIKARLTWANGSPQGWVTITPTGGNNPGDRYFIPLQVASAVSATGRYHWQIDIEIHFSSGDPIEDSLSGDLNVVVNGATPYGHGWSLPDLNYLVLDDFSGDSVEDALLVFGDGGSRYFEGVGDGSFVLVEAERGEPGTLAFDDDEDIYIYTQTDQTQYQFDLSGQLTRVLDTHGLAVTFTYSSGLLEQVTNPNGDVTTFGYDGGGVLATITKPRGQLFTLTYDNEDLVGVADPEGGLRTFTYSDHRLTGDQYGSRAATFAYDYAAISGVTLGSNTAYDLVPQLERALR